jgi:hypothetical protein
MKLQTTLGKLLLISFCSLLLSGSEVHAQGYCLPVFANGCSLWRNQSVTLDSINWVGDPYFCDVYDYTSVGTTLTADSTYQMQVVNGNWCGCGVWIDFNGDQSFDTTENVFHSYQANETNNYSFDITIPSNIPPGSYRMRVIAGWGSDCYNPGANGYGPCGLYQYGNFDDFTINVGGFGTAVTNVKNIIQPVEVYPNPAYSSVMVAVKNAHEGILQLTDFIGQVIYTVNLNEGNKILDLSFIPAGIYMLNYNDAIRKQSIRVIKE